ncbi:MAG: methyl-accepting chemotaxis protein [Pseudomonadota bacterium]
MTPLAPLKHRLDRLSTAAKLGLAFGLVLTLTAVIGGASVYALSHLKSASDELADNWLPTVGHLATVRTSVLEAREFEVKHTTASDTGYMGEYEEKMNAALEVTKTALTAHGKLLSSDDERQLRAAFDQHWQAYLATNAKVIGLDKGGQQADGKDISEGAGKSQVDDALAALDKLSAYSFGQGRAAADAAAEVYRNSQRWVVGLVAVSLLLGIALAVSLTRNLLRQLGGEPHDAARLLQGMAQGDLTARIAVRPGDRDSVMACLQQMQQGLSTVVSSVRQGSESVATASHQIAQGNNDLSGRTEQQASALQQTSASMEELGSTVTQNAENARQANDMAQQASSVAQQGGDAVGKVVATMRDINDSSKRIADITSVIDGIAFQTNILALNAAVEAARAGEQGRGFAVVASEVRTLAQRSATAAKEIKTLITASVAQIQQGSQQADEAGSTIDEAVRAIQHVTQIVNEITTASGEQSAGVNQVGQAISQMDQATQQNAALVEQSAAAAESLRTQAQQLVNAVAVFQLRG